MTKKTKHIQAYMNERLWRRAEAIRRQLEEDYGVEVSWSQYMNKMIVSWLDQFEAGKLGSETVNS